MSSKVYHFEINWAQVLLSSAMASGASAFLLSGDVPVNLSDIFIGMLLLVGAELAASYTLFRLATRHKQ